MTQTNTTKNTQASEPAAKKMLLTVGKLAIIVETLNFLIDEAVKTFTDKQGEWRKEMKPLIARAMNPSEAAHMAAGLLAEIDTTPAEEAALREEMMDKIMAKKYEVVDMSSGFGELIVAATAAVPALLDHALLFLLVAESDPERFTTFDDTAIRTELEPEIQALKLLEVSAVRDRIVEAVTEISRQLTGRADRKALDAVVGPKLAEAKKTVTDSLPPSLI